MADDWHNRLRPASFRGVEFKVDVDSRSGGRRAVEFEFPKRDTPYAEDMGRRARRFAVTGYVIGRNYTAQRDRLIGALEAEGPALLVHPLLGEDMVQADPYTVRETRQAGGMAEFEMLFVEAGEAGISTEDDTRAAVETAGGAAKTETVKSVDEVIKT